MVFHTSLQFILTCLGLPFLATIDSNINLKDLYDKQQSLEEIQNVLLVIRFYERLWVAIDNDQLKKELVPPLFGELFYWWFIYCFEDRLVDIDSWHTTEKIKHLKNWMDIRTNPSDREKWRHSAEEDQKSRKNQDQTSNVNLGKKRKRQKKIRTLAKVFYGIVRGLLFLAKNEILESS